MPPATPRRLALLLVAACAAGHADTGSRACEKCHAEIYRAYQSTGMARSSGTVTPIARDGKFDHKPSGVQYEIYRQGGSAFFSFDLPGVHGSRRLEYFIGSGVVGQSFLYSVDGFLYQAPVSWYSARALWDLSPGYEKHDSLFLTRGVEPACLRCHASRLQPLAATRNGYQSPPFLEGGIGCERCHGSGDEHVRTSGAILNPAKLPADRRDSICAQCHLAGEARIARAGRAGAYRPGDRLADSEVAFIWEGGAPDLAVTSHFERLAESACKKASGDRLWCGTCHEPHRTAAVVSKQAACLGCHETRQCARGGDCVGCHMPKSAVRGVLHTAYTDHTIRKPGRVGGTAGERKLVPFGGARGGDREFGLAYAGVPGFEKRALEYLERAPRDDAEVLAHLAYLYDQGGDEPKAMPLYEQALKIDPMQVTAAVNLAIARMRRGETGEAIRLWRHALERSPGLENARLSLGIAQYRTGDIRGAEASLTKLLELNPAEKTARGLLNEIRAKR